MNNKEKTSGAVYYFLGILESMVSGVYFYLASKDDDPKILNLLTSIVMFLCGFMHMCMGSDARKEEKAPRLAAEAAAFEAGED